MRSLHHLSKIRGITFACLWLTLTTGHAQQILEEVIVTAQKRAESVQDVPVTMQAFSADDLEKFRVSDITDIVKLSPNLNVAVQNAMSRHIVIRGVGTNEFFGNAPSSVGTYMDEVTMNSSYLSTLGLFDLERVEILRGPQNSLFGRNTTGGAVNYISKLPEVGGSVDGYTSLLYGSHNRLEAKAAGTIQLGETAALRLAGSLRDRDGRWHNVDNGDRSYGDSERYSVRGTLVWEPSPLTTITTNVHVARDEGDAQPQKAFGTLDPNNPPLRLIPDEQTIAGGLPRDIDFRTPVPLITSQGFNVALTDWDDVRTGGSQVADLEVDGGYIKVERALRRVNLTVIGAYDQTHGLYEEDNGVSGNVQGGVNSEALVIDMDQDYEQSSLEIRLASNDDSARLRWIAGLYYFTQDATLAQNIRFGTGGVLAFHPIVNGVPPSVFGFTDDMAGFFAALDAIPNPYANTSSFSIAELEDDSVSIYGHSDFDITDRLSATLGLRYTEDTKSNPSYFAGAFDITGVAPSTFYNVALLRQFAATLPGCAPISPTNPPFQHCANNNLSRPDIESEEVGGKIGLDYQLADDVMLFASYSRGFKSGKHDVEFLHTDTTPFPQRPLDVETLDAFEIGLKSTLLAGRMQINGALFFNRWSDQQVFNVGSNGPEFFNLPESEILGLEFEMKWLPSDHWQISAGLGLLDSEVTDATGINFDLGQGEFQQGHELPLSPPVSANWVLVRDFDLASGKLSVQLDGRYQSSSKAKFKPSAPIDEYEDRLEFNARADYLFGARQQYQLSFAVDNLTEEKYCLEKQDLHALVGAYYCVPNEGEAQYSLLAKMSF